MAEIVAVAVLFYFLGLLTKLGWVSDRLALDSHDSTEHQVGPTP
jgi:hypothetical protein